MSQHPHPEEVIEVPDPFAEPQPIRYEPGTSYELTEQEEGFEPTQVEYHRRWGQTIVFGILGLISGFATYKMVMIALYASAVAWIVVAFFGVIALGLLAAAVTLSSEAHCPACGHHQSVSTDPESRQLCYECNRFLLYRDDKMTTLPLDTVEEQPIFGLAIPRDAQLPPICVVCGDDATHAEPLSYKNNMIAAKAAVMVGGLLSGNPTLAFGGGLEASLPIPYCDQHNEGAVLKEVESEVILGVHSYRFARAYCQLNGKQLQSKFDPS